MDWFGPTVAVVGLFILRLGVPLVITLGVGYWLRRLDAKWEAEARARQAEARLKAESAVEIYKVIEQPCWVLHHCSETAYHHCPAYLQPEIPCWLARRNVEGQLPHKCYTCQLFTAGQRPRELSRVN